MNDAEMTCPTCGAPCFDGDPDGPPVFVYDPPEQGVKPRQEFPVLLRAQDADAILAALEWALNNEGLDLGPGIHRRTVEEAGRRIEAVADMQSGSEPTHNEASQ